MRSFTFVYIILGENCGQLSSEIDCFSLSNAFLWYLEVWMAILELRGFGDLLTALLGGERLWKEPLYGGGCDR